MTTHSPPAASKPEIMPPPLPSTRLRVVHPGDPAVGLDLAVRYLMSKSAFARLRFGTLSHMLVSQIDRGHYCLVVDDDDRVLGYLGWTRCTEATGEAWLVGRDFPDRDAAHKDCILFDACSADTPEVNRLLLRAARRAAVRSRLAYFRRIHADGAARLTRRPLYDLGRRDGADDRASHDGARLGARAASRRSEAATARPAAPSPRGSQASSAFGSPWKGQ